MPKWEYLRPDITYAGDAIRIITNFDPDRVIATTATQLINSLDNIGNQNWELVSVFRSGDHEIHYFKRLVT